MIMSSNLSLNNDLVQWFHRYGGSVIQSRGFGGGQTSEIFTRYLSDQSYTSMVDMHVNN